MFNMEDIVTGSHGALENGYGPGDELLEWL